MCIIIIIRNNNKDRYIMYNSIYNSLPVKNRKKIFLYWALQGIEIDHNI